MQGAYLCHAMIEDYKTGTQYHNVLRPEDKSGLQEWQQRHGNRQPVVIYDYTMLPLGEFVRHFNTDQALADQTRFMGEDEIGKD